MYSVPFGSVSQLCRTLCDPMNHSTPGPPVLEFTQTHVHRVSDAIQPSHPLSSPSPPAPNPSQHMHSQIDIHTYLNTHMYILHTLHKNTRHVHIYIYKTHTCACTRAHTHTHTHTHTHPGFPGGSGGKESACNAGDLGSIPGSGRPPGEGNGNPTQYSCLENPMDRERSIVGIIRGVAKSQTQLND